MKEKSKKSVVVVIAIAIAMLLILPIKVLAGITIPSPTDKFYVNDFAGIFREEEEQRLMDNAVALAQNYDGVQVVVSTVETLEGYSVEDYANEMYNQYRIGKNDMGVLILMSTGDRDIRVEVGDRMEGYLTDAKVGRLLDKFAVPLFKENKFNEGLIKLQEAIIKEVTNFLESEKKAEETRFASDTSESSNNLGVNALLFILASFFIILVFAIMTKKKKEAERIKMEERTREFLSQIDNLRIKNEQSSNVRKSLESEIRNLTYSINQVTANNKILENQVEFYQEKLRRAKILHPNLDAEIKAQIEEEERKKNIAAAAKVDTDISKVINLPAEKENYNEFSTAVSSYDSLTAQQKLLVKADTTRLKALYKEAQEKKTAYERQLEEERNRKKAKEVSDSIERTLSYISVPSSSQLSRLKGAKREYESLDPKAKVYVDQSIINRLNTIYRKCERVQEEEEERRRKEEEERRRRRREEEERRRSHSSSSYSSYSSHSSSRSSHSSSSFSSHSGFGGHSSGGGASRKF